MFTLINSIELLHLLRKCNEHFFYSMKSCPDYAEMSDTVWLLLKKTKTKPFDVVLAIGVHSCNIHLNFIMYLLVFVKGNLSFKCSDKSLSLFPLSIKIMSVDVCFCKTGYLFWTPQFDSEWDGQWLSGIFSRWCHTSGSVSAFAVDRLEWNIWFVGRSLPHNTLTRGGKK